MNAGTVCEEQYTVEGIMFNAMDSVHCNGAGEREMNAAHWCMRSECNAMQGCMGVKSTSCSFSLFREKVSLLTQKRRQMKEGKAQQCKSTKKKRKVGSSVMDFLFWML